MIEPSSRPLTPEAATELQRLLNAEIGPGLGERELDEVEARFGFRFAADHRVFLSVGLPHGPRSWPDWRHGDPEDLRARLAWPVDGVLFDVRHGFWYPGWGTRPEETADALRVARAELTALPQLVPIYSHRYLPGVEGESGHAVLSVHQTDVITYGNDLADYVRWEFTGRTRANSPARVSAAFWSYLVHGRPEGAFTTPHDPYEETRDDALEHLRMLALERLIGRQVYDEQLVQTGLVALALGVEAPSLPLLAGLTPDGYGQARELFERVLTELGIAAALPADTTDLPWEAARWELVHWWLRLIVRGSVRPGVGADAITYDGWGMLARPAALRPLVDLADGRARVEPGVRAERSAAVVAEAVRLLAGPWPAQSG